MRPLRAAVPGAVAELLRTAPLSAGKVEFAWRAAVGPALERATAVRLESGVLIVEATSRQWAQEVTRSSSVILRRVQTLLGAETVSSINVRSEPRTENVERRTRNGERRT